MKKILKFSLVVILFTLQLSAYAQEITVSGIVTDESGEPIPGVSISIKNTYTGTITDIDGKYSLSLANKDVTLVYSFIGFSTKEIAVGGQSSINVTLEQDVIGLDEVITVGYGVQKKATLSGAVGSITSEKLTDLDTNLN